MKGILLARGAGGYPGFAVNNQIIQMTKSPIRMGILVTADAPHEVRIARTEGEHIAKVEEHEPPGPARTGNVRRRPIDVRNDIGEDVSVHNWPGGGYRIVQHTPQLLDTRQRINWPMFLRHSQVRTEGDGIGLRHRHASFWVVSHIEGIGVLLPDIPRPPIAHLLAVF